MDLTHTHTAPFVGLVPTMLPCPQTGTALACARTAASLAAAASTASAALYQKRTTP